MYLLVKVFFYRNIEKLNHPEKLIIIFYTSGTIEAKNSCFLLFAIISLVLRISLIREGSVMYIDNILAHTEGAATGLAINYATGNFDSMLVVVKE